MSLGLLAPSLVTLGLVLFYPIVTAIYASFFNMNILNIGRAQFIGLGNYTRLLGSPTFWQSLRITALYTVGTVFGTYGLGLCTALLLHPRYRGRAIARTIAFVPWAVPQVAAVLIWSWMLDENYGIVNYLLNLIHVTTAHIAWREDPHLALISVLVVTIWILYPVATVMLLAGLGTIPTELYEAASVDGAGALRRFSFITWPGLAPVNVVLILLLSLMAFTRVVTIIYVMTAGGPSGATETLPILTYLDAFSFFRLGEASALGTIVLLLASIFTVVYFAIGNWLYPRIA